MRTSLGADLTLTRCQGCMRRTPVDVEYVIAGWVDWWSLRRLHGSIGQIPPVEHEQDHCAALKESRTP